MTSSCLSKKGLYHLQTDEVQTDQSSVLYHLYRLKTEEDREQIPVQSALG